MPVSVNMPAAKRDDSADVLASAISIARDVYKVKMDNKALDAANKLRAQNTEKEATDLDRKESLSFAERFEVVDPSAKGAIDPYSAGLQLPRGIQLPQGKAIRPRSVSENEAKLAQNAADKSRDYQFKKELAEIQSNNKAATEGAQASALFGKRMNAANETLTALENDPKAGVTDLSTGLGNVLLPNNLRSDAIKKFNNAKADFVTAALRKESGASISPSEFATAEQIYFAQPNDSVEEILSKQARRQLVIEQFQQNAGKAWSGGANTSVADKKESSGPSLEDLVAEKLRRQKQGTAQK